MKSFPTEAVLLFFTAIGIAAFADRHSASDWGASFVMIAIAVRWLRQYQDERKQS
jgi:hypothetical protein